MNLPFARPDPSCAKECREDRQHLRSPGADEAAHSEADLEYVRELGPVAPGPDLHIAYPAYGEVLPRVLTSVLQHVMSEQRTAFRVDADGGLKMDQRISGGTNQRRTCSKVLRDCTICAPFP